MSKPKIILFDVDGVLIKYRKNFTGELKEQGYNDIGRVMHVYYHEDYTSLYNEGKKSEEEVIAPFLREFGWKGSPKDYLDAQCDFAKRHLDQALISQIQKIRKEGTLCCLATNQGPYQGRFLLEGLDFNGLFDGHYISCDIGYKKNAAQFWEFALKDMEEKGLIISPWEVAYFDDNEENIRAASGFGIQGFYFSGNLQFENDMSMLGFDICLNEYFS